MEKTVAGLLDWLEKPENEDKIEQLAQFETKIKRAEGAKELRGISGVVARLIFRATRKHMDAFAVLAACKTPADIAAFRQTGHYERIKNSVCVFDDAV